MNDEKVLWAIKEKDEKMMAFVIQKYSKLLWKIASGVLINAASAEDIEELLADSGELTFDISGDSTNSHKVKIVCIDAAGNVQEEEITNFFVTTNIWVRYYTNKALFFGSIGGVILLAALIIFLVVWKKKKNET